MQVLGPGFLKINAASMDFGSILGVISKGIDTSSTGLPSIVASELAPLTARGAEIDIQAGTGEVAGPVTMLSTTIESEYGGDIKINCGTINVGTTANLGAGEEVRGIISLWGGNITVNSVGNVEVSGSRIASYDGGNVNITSDIGNVDAGEGGLGFIVVTKPYIDPTTQQLGLSSEYMGGSGILALSFPTAIPGQPLPYMGDITVTTPQGNIYASQGGIVQIPYGPVSTMNANINLTAGTLYPNNTVEYVGSIYAGNSGVVGGNITLNATGDIEGLIVARQNINIVSQNNVTVTAVAQGNVNITASGTVGGLAVGGGSVNVTGGEITSTLVGTTVNTTGAVSGDAAPAAPVVQTGPTEGAQEANKVASTATQSLTSDDSDDDKKKNKGRPVVTEYVGRVTIILPKS
jgi:hypothetical protein